MLLDRDSVKYFGPAQLFSSLMPTRDRMFRQLKRAYELTKSYTNPIYCHNASMASPNIVALPSLCYLCGAPLSAPIDWDHVPPRQLFAKVIRKKHSPNLLTIPVHAVCNKSYQQDEDYFLHALAPFGLMSYAGKAVLDEALD